MSLSLAVLRLPPLRFLASSALRRSLRDMAYRRSEHAFSLDFSQTIIRSALDL